MNNHDELKRKAEAVAGTCDHKLNTEEWTAFRYAANPTAVLELLSELSQAKERIAELESRVEMR